ncbi:hypothetical protein ACFLXC_05675 [Chloroflexota bacterium]
MSRDTGVKYKHTQVGYITIIAISAALVLIIYFTVAQGINPVGIAVLVLLAVALTLFSTLTVIILEDVLEVRFGSEVIKKRFSLKNIDSCQIVKNPWYRGWGIRMTPNGTLYNVSGRYAVRIRLRTGGEFNIGTDQPKELESAIIQAIRG